MFALISYFIAYVIDCTQIFFCVTMDSISNNECPPAGSQTHLGGPNYITGRDLLTHFANLTSQDRPKSKSPNSHANPSAASLPVTTCADIYSAILSSQQQGVIDEASSFVSPSRHLSEPTTISTRHSPVGNVILLFILYTPSLLFLFLFLPSRSTVSRGMSGIPIYSTSCDSSQVRMFTFAFLHRPSSCLCVFILIG